MKRLPVLLSLSLFSAWACRPTEDSRRTANVTWTQPADSGAEPRPNENLPTAADAQPESRCDAVKLTGCTRGMYVSTQNVLGDRTKEQELFDYAKRSGISTLSLYDLQFILRNVAETEALESFMNRARAQGIPYVEAIATESLEEWDLIAAFHRSKAPFDAMLTEIEFWHGSAEIVARKFSAYLQALQYVRSLALKTAQGRSVLIKTYVGWFDAEQAQSIVSHVDEVYLHAYVQHPSKAFGHTESRLKLLNEAMTETQRKISIKPIFSAEGPDQHAPGGEAFMGEWIKASPDPLDTADALYLAQSKDQGFLTFMTGTQYFLYDILRIYHP